jgi:hypothetical protein
MLSRGVRAVHRLTAVAYFGFGALLFLAPAWAAERFPWTVTPFVAMTIGGWCIGVTCFSWIGGRRGPVGAVLPVLTFVWLFGLSEIVVLFVDKPAFQVEAPLAIPYVLSLALTLASGGFGLLELLHQARVGEAIHGHGRAIHPGVHGALLAAAVVLGGLAIVAAFAGIVGPATSGKVFPEAVTLFTVRAFGALNLSLALGALVAVVRRSHVAGVWLAVAAVFLLVPTLVAALANLGSFDFANRPLGGLYIGVYAVGLAAVLPFAWRNREVVLAAGSEAATEAVREQPAAS